MRALRYTLWIAAVLFVAALGAWWIARPVAVRAHIVARGEVEEEALGTGAIESRRTVEIGFEVTGRVVELAVDQGDPIRAGQVLARVDDEVFRSELAVAERELSQARSALARLEAEGARAEAVLAGAEANSRRVTELHGRGVASTADLDAADERLSVATADLARARAATVEGADRIRAAEASVERARTLVARTVARSPFDGVVVRREREVGDVAVPGAAVLRVAATDVVWASVWVDETYLDRLSVGLRVRVALRSAPDRPLAGKVARLGREVDRETRELLVDVALDDLPREIALGQRADAWIRLAASADAVRVPSELVVRDAGRVGVWVVDAGRARFRAVELGLEGRDWVEVVRGLHEGERIAVPASGARPRSLDGVRVALEAPTP